MTAKAGSVGMITLSSQEVSSAVRKVKCGKVLGLDVVPVEARKAFGNTGTECFVELLIKSLQRVGFQRHSTFC